MQPTKAWFPNYTNSSYNSSGNLPNPGIEPRFPTLQTDSLLAEPAGRPNHHHITQKQGKKKKRIKKLLKCFHQRNHNIRFKYIFGSAGRIKKKKVMFKSYNSLELTWRPSQVSGLYRKTLKAEESLNFMTKWSWLLSVYSPVQRWYYWTRFLSPNEQQDRILKTGIPKVEGYLWNKE